MGVPMLRIIVRGLGREGPIGHDYERFYTIDVDDQGEIARFLAGNEEEVRSVLGIMPVAEEPSDD